jgi:hypothetical protein
VNLNTEITEVNCKSWFQQKKTIASGKECTVNVYTGWTVQPAGATSADVPEYDNSFTTIYSMVYDILNSAGNREIVAACHEMPFTVVTDTNLSRSVVHVDRSISEKLTGSLVGCHCNRLNYSDVKGIYWLSRLLEHFQVKLMIGGHKHTYACTNPLREFYYYGENKNSIANGPMTMERTLANDSAVWSATPKLVSGNQYAINGTGENLAADGTVDTTKFPLMLSDTLGITNSNNTVYPFYGVNATDFNRGTGVVYFMCQATGFKLKSNKELPSPSQRFSYVIPKTTVQKTAASPYKTDKPNANQQHPMFAEIKLNGSNSYTIYLYRVENIMVKSNLFTQWQHSKSAAQYKWLQGNISSDGTEDKLYGKWVASKTALIEI